MVLYHPGTHWPHSLLLVPPIAHIGTIRVLSYMMSSSSPRPQMVKNASSTLRYCPSLLLIEVVLNVPPATQNVPAADAAVHIIVRWFELILPVWAGTVPHHPLLASLGFFLIACHNWYQFSMHSRARPWPRANRRAISTSLICAWYARTSPQWPLPSPR